MKQRIYNGQSLEFYNSSNELKGEIKLSGSDFILNPTDGNGTVIFGEEGSINDIEVGAVGTPVDFTFLGGGTLTSNGGTLTIGSSGDTIDLSNTTISVITSSIFKSTDIFADDLELVNSFTASDGRITGDLSVLGSTKFGDSSTDLHTFTGSLSVLSGSSHALIVSSSGKVGINTDFLEKALTVNGQIKVNGTSISQYQWEYGDPELSNPIWSVGGGNYMRVLNGSTTMMNIDSAGNFTFNATGGNTYAYFQGGSTRRVGIGTTTPQAKLHVAGDITGSGNLSLDGSVTGSDVYIDNWGSVSASLAAAGGGGTTPTLQEVTDQGATTTNSITITGSLNITGSITQAADTNVNNVFGRVRLGSYVTDYAYFSHYDHGSNSSFALRQAPNGSTQINAATGQAITFGINNNGYMTLGSTGNVGIGTTDPQAKLHVEGDISASGELTVQAGDSATSTYSITSISGDLVLKAGSDDVVIRTGGSGTENIFFQNSALTNRVTIDAENGRLGIGTTSPVEPLDVVGTARFDNSITEGTHFVGDSLQHWGDGGTGLYFDTDTLSLKNDGATTRLHIATGGNVGIGTTNPEDKLEVFGNIRVANPNGANPTDAGSLIFDETGGTWGTSMYGFRFNHVGDDNVLKLQSANVTTVRDIITFTRDTARVGIGTTNPGERLEVSGSVKIDSTLKLYSTTNHYGSIYADTEGLNLDTVANRHLRFFQAGGEIMRINTSGNVGIGTTSPGATLHIKSPSSFSSTGSLQVDTTAISSTQVFMDLKGGSSGDQYIFRHYRSSTLQNWVRDDQGRLQFYTKPLSAYLGSTAIAFYADTTVTGNIASFGTLSNTYMVVSSSGNVGIGTTSPAFKLDVGGDSRVAGTIHMYGAVRNYSGDFSLQNGAQDADILFKVNNGGTTTTAMMVDGATENIGIGTTTPSWKLEVAAPDLPETNASSSNPGGIAIKATDAGALAALDFGFYDSGTPARDIVPQGRIAAEFAAAGTNFRFIGSANYTTGLTKELMILTTEGKLGIGTSDPDDQIHIYKNDTSANAMITLEQGGTGDASLDFVLTGANMFRMGMDNSNSDAFTFARGNFGGTLDIMTMKGYDVGIGNSNPSYKLDVSGSGNFTDGLTVTGSLLHDGDLTVTGTVTAQEFHTEFVSSSIIFSSGSTKFGDSSDDVHNFTGSINLQTSGSATNNYIKLTTSAGLGVATLTNANSDTTPVGSLVLNYASNGSAQITGQSNGIQIRGGHTTNGTIRFNSYLTEIMRVTSTGLGIGTTSPGVKLHVTSSGEVIRLQGASGQSYMTFFQGTGTRVGYIGTAGANDIILESADDLNLYSGGSSTMYLDTSGNVGIGTTSPSAPLEVSGSTFINDGSLKVTDDSVTNYYESKGVNSYADFFRLRFVGTEVMRVASGSGNVGIGNTAAPEKLTVAGNISGSGDISVLGNITGSNAYFSSNVSIGTTTATYPLNVQGDTTISSGELRMTNGKNIRFSGGQAFSADTTAGTVTISSHGSFTSTTINSNVTASGEISGSDVKIDDWGSVSASLATINAATVLPSGVVSSSAQIDHDQTTNFDSNEHFTQANITTVGTVTSGDVSAILPSGVVSGSDQVNADTITNFDTNVKAKMNSDAVVSGSATSVRSFLNVENGADVTDSTNVQAAGAVMDSEVTDLDGIKSLTVPNSTTISTFGASLVDDANATAARTTLGVDAAGTDNSTDVTLVTTSHDYLSLSGQAITLGQIDISDDTNLAASTGITLTDDTLTTNDSEIVHDNLSGFVANEHIDHSGVSITAGNGLSGGGSITTTRTLTLNTGSTHFTTGVSASAAAAGFGGGGSAVQVSVGQYTSTDTTTDVNTASYVIIPFNSTDGVTDTSNYSISSGRVTVSEAGTYWVYGHISYDDNGQTTPARANVALEIFKNGTSLGYRGAMGYLRNSTGHDEASNMVAAYVSVSANDIIDIRGIGITTALNACNLVSGESVFALNKVGGAVAASNTFADAVSDTGTALDLQYSGGSFYSMGSASSTTTYTTGSTRVGGWAKVFVNASSKPTVGGSTEMDSANSGFTTSTDCYLVVTYDGSNARHFFTTI